MSEEKLVVTGDVSAELTEKRSRFIAAIHSVRSEDEALNYIETVRKQYHDARHNCYAYLVGENADLFRFSDDGEPSGTAGRPILEVLQNSGLRDCVIVVTRYFGGILLGAGPLARAYGQAAALAVEKAKEDGVISPLYSGRKLSVRCNYSFLGKIQYLLAQNDIHPMHVTYKEDILFTLAVEEEKVPMITELIKEATAASAVTEDLGGIRFLKKDQKIISYGL
ncbi:MAG: YigZ family protein [Lachnospiraceae bacterium]|nr:YigZ family protein [Lachnospiraceae bacterium]